MIPLEEKQLRCPYCGENIDMLINIEDLEQSYTEDCEVCCRPIVVKVFGMDAVELCREDEV